MTDEPDPISCHGVRFPPDPAILTPRIAGRLRKGFYETDEIGILGALLWPGARVLELGGGLGLVSSYALLHGGAAHVTCVEANPVLCDYIRRVHAENGLSAAQVVTGAALPAGLPRPENGLLPFHVTDPFWSSSLGAPRVGTRARIKVPALDLETLVADSRAQVLICDIEGGEATLFGDSPLTGITHVMTELHTRAYGGEGIRATFDAMHRLGFYYHQKLSRGDVVTFERLASARDSGEGGGAGDGAQSGSISAASRVA